MKKGLLISFFIMLMFPLFSTSWGMEKLPELAKTRRITEGNFSFIVVPLPEEIILSNEFETWTQKRYSEQKMVEKAKEVIENLDQGMVATLNITYNGDLFSEGKSSLDIPDNFYEYIFAENERGDFLRCIKAEGSTILGSSVSSWNDNLTFTLTFAKTTDDGKDIFENAKELIFVVEGLDFNQNRIKYSLPLSDYFTDMPEQQRKILLKAKEEID